MNIKELMKNFIKSLILIITILSSRNHAALHML